MSPCKRSFSYSSTFAYSTLADFLAFDIQCWSRLYLYWKIFWNLIHEQQWNADDNANEDRFDPVFIYRLEIYLPVAIVFGTQLEPPLEAAQLISQSTTWKLKFLQESGMPRIWRQHVNNRWWIRQVLYRRREYILPFRNAEGPYRNAEGPYRI